MCCIVGKAPQTTQSLVYAWIWRMPFEVTMYPFTMLPADIKFLKLFFLRWFTKLFCKNFSSFIRKLQSSHRMWLVYILHLEIVSLLPCTSLKIGGRGSPNISAATLVTFVNTYTMLPLTQCYHWHNVTMFFLCFRLCYHQHWQDEDPPSHCCSLSPGCMCTCPRQYVLFDASKKRQILVHIMKILFRMYFFIAIQFAQVARLIWTAWLGNLGNLCRSKEM